MKKQSHPATVDCASDSANIGKNPHAVALGRLGGAAGTGASKVRTPEQCRKAAAARWAKHKESKNQ
jgi:hypothetical protein